MAIYGFYHICTINHWQQVVNEQIKKIISSGLYNKSDKIFIAVIGPHCQYKLNYDKFQVIFSSPDLKHFERPVLEYMRRFSETANPNDKFYYLHSKGVSHKYHASIDDWNHFMEYFLIERYEHCLLALEEHDACGVNWGNNPKHFSGNFWWAKASYIRKLPEKIGKNYYDPEMWIGLGNPKSKCLHQSGINHYYYLYPQYLYASNNLSISKLF